MNFFFLKGLFNLENEAQTKLVDSLYQNGPMAITSINKMINIMTMAKDDVIHLLLRGIIDFTQKGGFYAEGQSIFLTYDAMCALSNAQTCHDYCSTFHRDCQLLMYVRPSSDDQDECTLCAIDSFGVEYWRRTVVMNFDIVSGADTQNYYTEGFFLQYLPVRLESDEIIVVMKR